MYSNTSKFGRGGGGGRGVGVPRNRTSFPPPPLHRPSSTGRLSIGSAPRSRGPATATPAAAAQSVEESFSLVSGNNPLAFAMIIRLAPDLVEEIRRLEAQGGTARIKFDSIANNTIGNVIDVGGKEFRFTWSKEFGDLCDIYEEHHSEDGNGLLVESGSAWRKLNVQRVLDESTKKHVKMRSEEAERKHKSRQTVIIDENPATNKKQLAAVEASTWKSHFKKKEPPVKKRKVEPSPVGPPPKTTYKSSLTSTANGKGRLTASPVPSPADHYGAPASPSGRGNVPKSQMATDDDIHAQSKSKENAVSSDKETQTRSGAAGLVQETPASKLSVGAKSMDLKGMLITVLKENPKGMTFKALEKAIGDAVPEGTRKIDPILKKIANYQAPGRYFLRSGMELEGLNNPSSESGSSPEDSHPQIPASEDNHLGTPAPAVEKFSFVQSEEQTELKLNILDEQNVLETTNMQRSPNIIGERKASDNIDTQAGSASDSGSDSDSESDTSDSESNSGSHSRSRSGSSSDSETDASSNSKEGSDEDVDIMTSDDDKQPQHGLHASEPGTLTSPIPWQHDDSKPSQRATSDNQDADGSDAIDIEGAGSDAVDIEGQGSDAVEIEKDLADGEEEIGLVTGASNKEEEKLAEGTMPSSLYHDELQERQNIIGNLFDDTGNIVKDTYRHEQSDSSERISKLKRGFDINHVDKKSEQSKRSKGEIFVQPSTAGNGEAHFIGSHYYVSPNGPPNDTKKASPFVDKVFGEENANFGSQRGCNDVYSEKPVADIKRSGRRPFDQTSELKATATEVVERPGKHSEGSGHGRKLSERNVHDGYSLQNENIYRDGQNSDGPIKGKKLQRNLKEGGVVGKQLPSDLHYQKHVETVGRSTEVGKFSSLQRDSSPKDNNKDTGDGGPVNGRATMLQRELSDLELGEFRESLPDETPSKRQSDRKASFKLSDSKPSMSDSDLSKGKLGGRKTAGDMKKTSPPNLNALVRSTPELHAEDMPRSHNGFAPPQQLSRVDNADYGSHLSKSIDVSSKSRQNETSMRLNAGVEGYGESHRRVPNGMAQQQDSKRGPPHSTKENKALTNLRDGCMDTASGDADVDGRKRKVTPSQEDCFSKYEKEKAEHKGPIKDFCQYKEFVQEYRDKYDCYCSLNKILESYRNEFEKLGKDLESSKGGDKEKFLKTLEQIKESYRQCAPRHKRLKKIFVVLHEELQNIKQRIKDYALSYPKDSGVV